jgi:superfamily II DNA or RNA helicase
LNQTAKVQTHFGGTKASNDAEVVITTYSGFLNDHKAGNEKLGEFDVVIADECHRSLGPATSDALMNAYPGAFKIGLSATPDYAEDRKSDEVYDRSLFEFRLIDAVEAGRTAPIRTLIYQTQDRLRLTDQRPEFTERELEPLMHSRSRNGTALELSRSFVAEDRQGIIACIPGGQNYHSR